MAANPKVRRMIIMLAILKIILVSVVTGLSLSCHSYGQERDKKVLDVLSGFTFVGSGPAKFADDSSIDTTDIPSHDETTKPAPQNLERGILYVFHHRAPVDDESLALQELPDKLTKNGFRIIKAPTKASGGLIWLISGGPLFYIKFSDGNREFAIFNQLAPSHSEAWAIHDYLLVRTR
jgi:hypothetical protein